MNARVSLRAALFASAAVPVALPASAYEFELAPVVLAESKRDVATDTAISTTTIDQEEIKDRQATTVGQLIESVPGVTLMNGTTPLGSGINIRGFGANGTYGTDQKILVMVDGASVGAEELYRIGTQLFTDPELFREVQVIRGMAGTFEYGSGAIGGMVRLETKDASDFTGGEPGFNWRQTLQYGTNGDEVASSSILAWQPTENFEVLGNFTYRSIGVQTDGDGNDIGTEGYEAPSYALATKYTFGESDNQYLRFSYTDTTSAQRDVPYDMWGDVSGSFGNVDRDIHAQTATLTYGYDNPENDLINITATLSYAKEDIDSTYIDGSSPYENDDMSDPDYWDDWATLNYYVIPLLNADHDYETTTLTLKNQAFFETGAFAHDLRTGVDLISKYRLDAMSAPGGTDNRLAVFVVDDITTGGWTITPALRFEAQEVGSSNYGYWTNSAWMGGLSLRYEFDSGFSVFGSYADGSNLPILDDQTNPAYMNQRERAQTYELGFGFDRGPVFGEGDNLSLKVTAYHTNVWDLTSTFSSITSAEMEGVELEASYSTLSGWYTDVNANLQSAWNTTEGVSADWTYIPANELRVTLGKRWGETYDVSWESIFADERFDAEAYAVHNLRATYRPQDGWAAGTEFRVGVENVFDLDYQPYLSSRDAPGRTFKFSVARTF